MYEINSLASSQSKHETKLSKTWEFIQAPYPSSMWRTDEVVAMPGLPAGMLLYAVPLLEGTG